MTAEPPVLLERRGPVAVLTLHRPHRMNGWTPALERLYFDYLADLSADPEVKAIVVTGAGRAFCAGADMADLDELGSGAAELAPAASGRPKTFPLSVPKPVVAAINGACAGLGLVQALMCDVRLAATTAKLTTSFSKIGLVAEHGISWLLPRHVGIGHALDLLLSSRVVQGEEALRMGLVQQVHPPEELLDAAVAYAQELADRVSPAAMASIKAQVYRHAELELRAALEDSDQLMRTSLAAPDFAEGVAAFQAKRLPAFEGIGQPPG
ncbi:MAG: Enoyl-CoA hydratase/isomerase [Frankiales bacterium]|jgi:enoyl-CoA hydratase/carnithine racemase|nr:Enoyl-CoA hydratase/isomerase [Frankiales bacterium]